MDNKDFTEFFDNKRDEMLNKWNRVLPSNELLFDRWDKAKYIGAGEGTSIYDSCMIIGDVEIGENVWIGPFSVLDGLGGLKIGNGTRIGMCTELFSHDGSRHTLSGGVEEMRYAATEIGEFCHVGANSTVYMGITIGHHSLVGAGSVITKSFPPYSIIAGVPARRIGQVEIDENNKVEYTIFKSED